MAKIGVFDSGVGGLTVLKELAAHFPNEEFLYLGDTARLPYGTKSPETIRQYSEQILNFLTARKVDALIIACNTASSQVPEKEWLSLPVFNVIEPGAEFAVASSENKHIGVLGTRALVASGAYQKEILKLSPDAQVFAQSCPLFVPLAEEGWLEDPITNLIAYRYLHPLLESKIDTLILGCTHYPL
ncbi:MAG: glutamate racemase [Pseudobdellovibrionaceae bacterium]